jgi:LmbE family N-acetylglucosaminyl deacetylase
VLPLTVRPGRPLRILALGAHSDDIEIGCGGTLLSLLRGYPASAVHWVVFSALGDRRVEASRSADAFLADAAERDVRLAEFRDGFMPFDGHAVKDYFEGLKADISPDVIFTHRLEDRHQDHRLLADLTWNTFRNHVVLEYEIPKYEGDLAAANLFVGLSPEVARRKVSLLMDVFGTQRSKRWFREEVFEGLMCVRAIEAGLPEGHAEAFYARKLLFQPGSRE